MAAFLRGRRGARFLTSLAGAASGFASLAVSAGASVAAGAASSAGASSLAFLVERRGFLAVVDFDFSAAGLRLAVVVFFGASSSASGFLPRLEAGTAVSRKDGT